MHPFISNFERGSPVVPHWLQISCLWELSFWRFMFTWVEVRGQTLHLFCIYFNKYGNNVFIFNGPMKRHTGPFFHWHGSSAELCFNNLTTLYNVCPQRSANVEGGKMVNGFPESPNRTARHLLGETGARVSSKTWDHGCIYHCCL